MKKTINSEGTDPQVKEGKSKYRHQKGRDNTCFFVSCKLQDIFIKLCFSTSAIINYKQLTAEETMFLVGSSLNKNAQNS